MKNEPNVYEQLCHGCGYFYHVAFIECPKCQLKALQIQPHDPVQRPSHYTQGRIECINAIEAALTHEQFIGYLRGQAIKYAWRAGRKENAKEDLEKAVWYASREISTYSKQGGAK